MPISKELPYSPSSSSRRSFSLFQHAITKKKLHKTSNLFIPKLDAESERLFRQERQTESLNTLKTALCLGSFGFLAFIVLDIFNGGLSSAEIIARSMIVSALAYFWARLYKHPEPKSQIRFIAKLSATLSVIALIGVLWVERNPAYYSETWVGLLPIYFFTYGQMFMTMAETLSFGVGTMIAMPLCGFLIGVDLSILMSSLILLLIINIFGFFTRIQLETVARNLFRERRKAESSSENKTLFLRQLSHNLRQPLQALSCYASVLDAAYADKPGDSLHPFIGKMGFAIDELNRAFNHILDIANLEAGQQMPLLTSVDINVLLSSLEDQFTPQATKRGLKLVIRLRSKPPYTVFSDTCILGQIVGNLIDNAIKYTTSGWILVKTVKAGNNQLKLHVCDTGIGITEQQRQNIFKEFYRGHRRRQDHFTYGMGIGLTYVLKAIDHLPNHSLDFYSKPNLGSDFRLNLPIAIESIDCKSLFNHSRRDLTGCFVYLVEDDQQVLNAMAEQLTAWGCLVQKASSKDETLAAVYENFRTPDLLITDFYLDNHETAHDIIAIIEADCGPVPTIILSAHTISREDKARFSETTQLIRKPASAAVLMEMMAKAMGK